MDFTSGQWAKFNQQLDWIYEDFTNKVAQGRGLSKDQVLEIAEGRIWTGEDAKAIGLVDELGGFPVALRLAKEAAGIAEEAKVHVQVFPPQRSLVKILLARLQGEETEDEGHAIGLALYRTAQQLQPLARLAQDLGLGPDPGVLSMPEWEMGREE